MSVRMAGPVRQGSFEVDRLESRMFLSAGGSAAEAIGLDVAHEARVSGTYGPSATEWFSFKAEKGTAYLFTFPTYSYHDSFDLYGEDGKTILASPSVMDANRIEWTAPRAGTFFVRVHAEEVARGGDQYWLNGRILKDDYGDSVKTAGVLPASGEVTAHMEGVEDSDWFSFKADTDHTYTISDYADELVGLW
jgi:hypothetical protein